MPRSLRYFLVWMSCTTLTVAAVSLTVRFVVRSTAPLPPTAHAVPTVFAVSSSLPQATGTATAAASGFASPSSSRLSPSPSAPQPSHQTTAPQHPGASASSSSAASCPGGAGTHTIQSVGGQVTVDFGEGALCLVSAVPALGFTTMTSQSAPDTLTVTFSGSHHRSEITTTLHPQPQAVTREVSW